MPPFTQALLRNSLVCGSALFSAVALVGMSQTALADGTTWPTFNGNLMAQKYSPNDQINRDNVGTLEMAWKVNTGDVSDGKDGTPATVWSATPLVVNDTVYLSTPFYRIFALRPDTGGIKWVHDTTADREAPVQNELKNRGMAYWQAESPEEGVSCQKMVYIGTMEATLHAVDADTGVICPDFGDNGILSVNAWNTTNAIWPLALFQAPLVVGDTLVLGWSGNDWQDTVTPPGSVFGIDARTGDLKWTFRSIPEEMFTKTGTANTWASMSADIERGLVYVPVASPSPNFYGGNRLDPIPLATSVTALDVNTGDVAWSYQLVHHDLWDYDTNAAPTLVDLQHNGETVPALVQTGKQGFLYVLNRETGEPIFPILERPVPASDVPGEQASPTQPIPTLPAPVVGDTWPGVFELADIASFGYCSRTAEGLRDEGRFTPPSLQGTLQWPSTVGGIEWGGGAVDPTTRTYVVNNSVTAQIAKLIPRADYDEELENKASAHTGYVPMRGVPYGLDLQLFMNPLGMPCWKPPYGQISAYNLDTGERLWQVPFGQIKRDGFYMPEDWGTITLGGPVITAGGVIFIGASMDNRVRALNVADGSVLWKADVSAPAVATPATYMYDGTQYVVFTVGGNSILSPTVSDEIVAYRLPQN
ncbi:MAG: pyrroloquinoline quinone-dependent dehydrogenase [Rhodobacteraceae bacterium]|nr:pyrroloquinoline quinone-dependent dehydrogenase [Paracoccaceae bacterium]